MYFPSSENKGTDQLHGYHKADLRLCFHLCNCWFSHEAAHIIRPERGQSKLLILQLMHMKLAFMVKNNFQIVVCF